MIEDQNQTIEELIDRVNALEKAVKVGQVGNDENLGKDKTDENDADIV